MKELRSIVNTYKTIDFSKNKAAIATVVKVQGSSYRRAGARMIMTDDGRWTGAISGGCLEGDALRKARKAILNGAPSLVTYDTMEDKDAMSLGVGLGCNGIIDVLIEPVDQNVPNQINFLEEALNKEEPAVLATVYQAPEKWNHLMGQRWWLNNHGISGFESLEESLRDKLVSDMKMALKKYSSFNVKYKVSTDDHIDVFIEFLPPRFHMILFGGGYDAIPVAKLAKEIGWKITVTDDCVVHIAPSRFPAADQVLFSNRDEVVQNLSINDFTAAVLISHNYKYDLAILKSLLKTEIQYIGILGPYKRFVKMQGELEKEGNKLEERDLKRIFSPIGLDIGAETPDEIAFSIISEIQAFFNKRPGSMLKFKEGPIHKRENGKEVIL
ncbi:XdhC family protein [soil metagenome]